MPLSTGPKIGKACPIIRGKKGTIITEVIFKTLRIATALYPHRRNPEGAAAAAATHACSNTHFFRRTRDYIRHARATMRRGVDSRPRNKMKKKPPAWATRINLDRPICERISAKDAGIHAKDGKNAW